MVIFLLLSGMAIAHELTRGQIMKLFSQNAGQFLFEKAKSLTVQHDSWRCLYMNFSDHRHSYNQGLRTHVVTTIIKELLEDDYGYIYLCDDGDVFILFQGQAFPILNKIGEQFQGVREAHGHGQPEDELYTLFDLSRHWQVFYALSKSKAPLSPVAAPVAQTVPARPLLSPDAELFSSANAARAARKRPLIMMVEDDPFTRRLAVGTLKGECDVVEAEDAADALRHYGTHAPDAVFLDIELPDASGHVVLSRLLAFDPAAYVVMLSANSVKENILAALEKGAQGFVTKPFAKEKLMHYLRQAKTKREGRQSVGVSA